MPVVDVCGVGPLLHDPTRVALSPLGHDAVHLDGGDCDGRGLAEVERSGENSRKKSGSCGKQRAAGSRFRKKRRHAVEEKLGPEIKLKGHSHIEIRLLSFLKSVLKLP